MPIDCTKLGERIKYFRTKQDYSQEQLAELVGISRTHLSSLERNEKEPKLETIVKLAQALQMSIDQLVGLAPTSDDEPSLLWDCSEEERDILVHNMKDLKAILRRYRINK